MTNCQLPPADVTFQGMEGTIYWIPDPFLPWLWPALAITGIALQILAIFYGKRVLVIAAFPLVLLGAWPERDVTLIAGDLAACIGLWFCLRS